jgi:hypothetical protein
MSATRHDLPHSVLVIPKTCAKKIKADVMTSAFSYTAKSLLLHDLLDALDLPEQRSLHLVRLALSGCDAAYVRAVDPELLRDTAVDPAVELMSIESCFYARIFSVTVGAHAHSWGLDL